MKKGNYYLNRAFALNFFMTPIYVAYLLDQGLSFTQISSLHIIRDIAIFCCEIPFGMLADWLGRKLMIYLSIGLAVAALLCFTVMPQFSFFALAFALWGGAIAADSGTVSALVYESLPDKTVHQKLVSTSEVWRKLAHSIVNFIGGILYLIHATLPFIASIGLMVIPLVSGAKMPNTKPKSQTKKVYWQQLREHLKQSQLIISMLSISLLVSAFSLVFMYQQPVLEQIGINVQYFGVVFAGLLFIGMIGSYCVRHLSLVKQGPQTLVVLASLLIVSIVAMVPTFATSVVLMAMVALALLNGLVYPLKFILINQGIDDSVRSSVLSVQSYCEFFVKAAVSVGVAWLADTYSLTVAIQAIAVLPLIVFIIYGVIIYQQMRDVKTKERYAD